MSSSGDSSSDTEPCLKKSHDDDAASTSTSSCDHSDDVSEEGEIDVGKLTLKSAEVILMVAFEEKKLCDVKLHGQILHACRF
ncbi:hypothetical protein OS493_024310 [Desmophyllum pertusum]|uniref:Uncharacterized protein n=1 Tax=Desmophyllum pertusum TaxID=174260 RepID=A0A9W9YYC6_9CNID|nr:hypothetical protein OS493_024310 [Desmophyllum pertusum]